MPKNRGFDLEFFERSALYAFIQDERSIIDGSGIVPAPSGGGEDKRRRSFAIQPFFVRTPSGRKEVPYRDYDLIEKSVCKNGLDVSDIGVTAYNIAALSKPDGTFLAEGREIKAIGGIIDTKFEQLENEYLRRIGKSRREFRKENGSTVYREMLRYFLQDDAEPLRTVSADVARRDGKIQETPIEIRPGTRTSSGLSIAVRYKTPVIMCSQSNGGRLLVIGENGLVRRYGWERVKGLSEEFYVDSPREIALVRYDFDYDRKEKGAYIKKGKNRAPYQVVNIREILDAGNSGWNRAANATKSK